MERRAVRIRIPALAQDAVLGIVVAVMQVQGSLAKPQDPDAVPLSGYGHLGYLLLVVSGLALALRRRYPVAVFLTTAVLSLTYYWVGFEDGPGWIALFVALYTLTAYGDGRRSVRLAGLGITVLAIGWIAAPGVEHGPAIGWLFFRIAAAVMAAALGESVRSRAAGALERAWYAERGREEEARSRVDAERLRIAREVHDTVAHALAIINVQAGVTAYLLRKQPEGAREALLTIEQTSAQVLHELRAVLGVLRDPDNGRVPYPGLGQVDELTAQAREAGLDVELDVTPPPVPLPSAVDHTVYRIVQESITNVLRHAGPTRVRVAIDHGPDVLEVRVTDDGATQPLPAGTGGRAGQRQAGQRQEGQSQAGQRQAGQGIAGMRERCGLLGGELTAGPRECGGFEVTARLPLATPAEAAVSR